MSISLVPRLTWAPPSAVRRYVCFNCINSTKFLTILRFIPESPHQGKVYFSTAVLARWWLSYAISLYKKKRTLPGNVRTFLAPYAWLCSALLCSSPPHTEPRRSCEEVRTVGLVKNAAHIKDPCLEYQ